MSDFLQIADEIINGTPKYNITANGDGTSSIELANEVVHQGTPLNKANLHKIDSVLGYHELEFTIEPEITPYANDILPKANWTPVGGQYAYKSTNDFGDVIISGLYNGNNATDGNTNSEVSFWNYGEEKISFPVLVRAKKIRIFSRVAGNVSVGGIIDGAYTQLAETTTTTNSWTNITITNENFFDTYSIAERTGGNLYISEIQFTDSDIMALSIDYSIDLNFIDKQIINVYIPTHQEVNGNTLNGKPIDTLLQSNKYYELIYDEPNDRFIAYETRV